MVIGSNIPTVSILLHTECDNLSVMRKALPHHAEEMQADIRSQLALGHVQLIMARIRSKGIGAYPQALSYQGKGRPPAVKVI